MSGPAPPLQALTSGQLPAVPDPSRAALARTDLDLRVVEVEPKGGMLCDLDLGALCGTTLLQSIPELEAYGPDLEALKAAGEGEVVLEQLGSTAPDGSEVYRNLQVLPHHGLDGEVDGLVVVIVDVSEQVRLEQQIVQAHNDLHLLNCRLGQAQDRLRERDRLLQEVLTSVVPRALRALQEPERKMLVDLLWQCVLESADQRPPFAHGPRGGVGAALGRLIAAFRELGAEAQVVSESTQHDEPALQASARPPRPGDTVVLCTVCPWGVERAKADPVLCSVTEALFARGVAAVDPSVMVTLDRSLARGDPCCRLVLHHRRPSG